MKKTIIAIAMLFSATIYSQVGIGTTSPNENAILELNSEDKGLLIPRVALSDLSNAAPLSAHVEGMVVFNTTVDADNGLLKSFYYNDGTKWIILISKDNQATTRSGNLDMGGFSILNAGSVEAGNFQIYDDALHPFFDGNDQDALTVINRENNKTYFNDARAVGLRLLTLTNTEDDGTDIVESNAGHLGIGSNDPKGYLHVNNRIPGNTTDLIVAENNIDTYSGSQGRNLVLNNTNSSNPEFASIDFVASSNPTAPSAAAITGIDRDVANGYAGFGFYTRNNTNYAKRMVIKSSGNVGVGVDNPTSKLEVNGAYTNQSATNAGSTNTLDFATSNIIYTATTAGTIVLNNLKNGGAYSIALTSTAASGAVAFSGSGLTYVYMGTDVRVSGKRHIYNIMVADNVGYVTMATEN